MQMANTELCWKMSKNALNLYQEKFSFEMAYGGLVADASFDVVTCAGSISYGEPALADAEIRRVLRPGGLLICVDTLNHNPIYRLNRWLHYWRSARTKSTLQRMPDLARIEALSFGFTSVNVQYYGALSFALPVVVRLCGQKLAWAVSDLFDRLICVKRSAFKFVLVAKGLKKQ